MQLLYPKVTLFSSPSLLFFLLITLFFQNIYATFTLPKNEIIPAIISFGDSLLDPGNNNNLNTQIRCNYPPYGKDLKGGIPTGRCCNGRIPTDWLVEEFGIKKLLPAYLDPNLQIEDLLTGVSFASAGSGYDPLTAKLLSVLSMSDQLKLFKEYIGKLKNAVGEEKTTIILSKSIFLVGAGSNDISITYFLLSGRANYTVAAYTDFLVSTASSFIKELYNLGARRIAVLNAPPVGCAPLQRRLASEGGVENKCADNCNQAAELFDSKLKPEINLLCHKLPQALVAYLDVYSPLVALIQNHAAYGFEVESKECCATGNELISITSNDLWDQNVLKTKSFTSPLCIDNASTYTDGSKYIFWDGYHPTEKAYWILVQLILKEFLTSFF